MIDSKVLASINLHAVLRNLETVTQLDADAKDLLKGHRCAIRFSVPGIDRLTLAFEQGRCQAARGEAVPASMNLRFSNADHLNLMIEGKKNPLPTKGFRSIGFLKRQFADAASLLSMYLRPDPKRLKSDPDFYQTATILFANTAFYAAAEVANLDPVGQALLAKIEPGSINVMVGEDYRLCLTNDNGLSVRQGMSDEAKAYMSFDSLETAGGVLRGELDGFVCVGRGQMAFKGRIPMIDNLNKLLLRVEAYLS